VEVDRSLETLLVPESSGVTLDFLDHGVEAFGTGVRRAGDHCRQDAFEMRLDRSRHLLDRFESRADGPAVPDHPGPARPASDLVVPQAHGVGLDRPGPGGLEVGGLERLEATPALVGHVVGVLKPKVAAFDQHRLALGQQGLVLGPANLVDGIAEMHGNVELVEGDLVLGSGNVGQRRIDERAPHIHRHRSQARQRLGRLRRIPGIQSRTLAVVGDVKHPIATADHRHILVPALKRGLVDADRVRKILRPPRQAARYGALLHAADRRPAQSEPVSDFRYRADFEPVDHQRFEQRRQSSIVLRPGHRQLMNAVLRTPNPRHLRDQPGLVLAGVEMPPLALAGVVARTARPTLRAGQIRAGMANMDSHAGAWQVDFNLGNLPGRLNAENLPVELAVVHETGLESGPAGSLSEPVSPHKTGKSHLTVAAASIGPQIFTDTTKIDPLLEKAIHETNPNFDPSLILDFTDEEMTGILNSAKGKYFEYLVTDSLNSGGQVGDVMLPEGYKAVMADSINQPGWDLQILDSQGNVSDYLQLKATNSIAYIRDTLERYPDIEILATDEIADRANGLVLDSGITEESLNDQISSAIDSLDPSLTGEFLNAFNPLLPLVFIVATEGYRVSVGRYSLNEAIDSTRYRAERSMVATGIGAVVYAIGGGWLALPATFITGSVYNHYKELSLSAYSFEASTSRLRKYRLHQQQRIFDEGGYGLAF